MKTVDFSETIEACDLKVGRYRQLIDFMKVCEYSRPSSAVRPVRPWSDHFFGRTLFWPDHFFGRIYIFFYFCRVIFPSELGRCIYNCVIEFMKVSEY